MSELVVRQLAMLNLIPRGAPGISTRDIERALNDQGYSISRRSIQRDLETMSSVYPLVCETEGRSNLWYFMKTAGHVLLSQLDLETSLTLKLVECHLISRLPQRVRGFLEPYFAEADKVLSASPSRLKNWLDKTRSIPWGLQQSVPDIDPDIWRVVSQAVIDQQKCDIRYQAHQSEAAKLYRVSPLGIVVRGSVSYLLAVFDGYRDVRQLALHRMCDAQLMLDDAEAPADFCLDRYIAEGHFGVLYDLEPCRLRLQVSTGLSRLLMESPLDPAQKLEQTDHGMVLTCSVQESADLYRWLIAHSAQARVLSPVRIRSRLVEQLKQGLERQLEGDGHYGWIGADEDALVY